MNSIGSTTVAAVNLRAVIWDLLRQWKAVLLFAVIITVAVTGMKYARDTQSYNEQLANQAKSEEQSSLPLEEQTDAILAALSDSDRSDVEYILKEKEWIRTQKEYLNDSILLNVNPTNQRTLLMDYKVTTAEPTDMTALLYAYLGHIYDKSVIEAIGNQIGSSANSSYIAELISYDISKFSNIDSIATDAVLEFRIVVPESADANAIEQAVTSELKDYSSVLAGTIGDNSLKLLSVKDFTRYNIEAINNRTNIIYSIYNMQNNIKNSLSLLSSEGRTAVDSIEALQTEEREAANNKEGVVNRVDAPSKPGISKKYVLIGFILGVIIYAFVYLLYVMLKRIVIAASDVEYYTGGRLIGEIYKQVKHVGINKLFYSKIIDKYRYRGKLDTERQITKTASSIEAICKHFCVDEVSLLCTSKQGKTTDTLTRAIADSCKEGGIDTAIVPVGDDVEGNLLEEVKNAIIIAGRETKVPIITNLMELCNTFDVRSLGNVYIQEL